MSALRLLVDAATHPPPGRCAIAAAAACCLVLPAPALAHGRGGVVALDYRLTLDSSGLAAQGVEVAIVDGDRDLSLSAAPGVSVLVRGELGEGLVRIDASGVWINASSPTAASDHLVSPQARGWVRVSNGRSIVWHDHRLLPPPRSGAGPDGAFAIPIDVDGHPETIAGSFIRIQPPAVWPWLLAAAAIVGAIALAARRRPLRAALVVGLGATAALAALIAVTTFAADDTATGGVGWPQVGAAGAIAAVLGLVVVRCRGAARVQALALAGAAAALASLSSLSVFWHGVVVSLLPASAARALCGLGLIGGLAAITIGLSIGRAPRRASTR